MLKKVGAILLALLMVFSLSACAGGQTPTDQAKATVDGFFKALKNVDSEEMKKYVSAEDAGEVGDQEDIAGNKEMSKKFLSKVEAKYKSGEIPEDASEGKLVYELTHLDLSDLFGAAMGAFGNKGIIDSDNIDFDNIGTVVSDVEISFKKDGDKWVIADPETVVMHILGIN